MLEVGQAARDGLRHVGGVVFRARLVQQVVEVQRSADRDVGQQLPLGVDRQNLILQRAKLCREDLR